MDRQFPAGLLQDSFLAKVLEYSIYIYDLNKNLY